MILKILTSLFALGLVVIVLRVVQLFAQTVKEYHWLPSIVAIFISVWLVYLSVLSHFQTLTDTGFPPRIPVFVVLPLLIILGILLFQAGSGTFVDMLSIKWLIYFQSFRIIVEVIIWGAYQKGMLPMETTFEGYNFDIAVGISAVPLATFADRIKMKKTVFLIWNVISLIILANTVRVFIGSIYYPVMFGHEYTLVGPDFFKLPYLFIPGLFLPLAVYVHAFSIKQLVRLRDDE